MPRPDSPDFETTAIQFGAVADFVGSLREPRLVEELVDVLNKGDADRFADLTVRYGDFPNRCSLMCHIAVEVISTGSAPKLTEQCSLRTDLTPSETFTAFMIYRRHHGTGGPAVVHEVGTLSATVLVVEVIPAGPYLDELKASGLVTCRIVRTGGSGFITGAREFVCMEVCPP
jgi:hypothetical protein